MICKGLRMGAMKFWADDDVEVVGKGEGAEVKEFVVEGAEGEAVGNVVGSVVCVPLNVGGFKAYGLSVQLQVVAADGALVLVIGKNGLRKVGVPLPFLFGDGGRFHF